MRKNSITRRKFVKVAAVAGGVVAVGGMASCTADSTAPATSLQDGSSADQTIPEDDFSSALQQDAATSNEVDGIAESEAVSDEITEDGITEDAVAEGETEEGMPTTNDALVLIYSRADENYNVGYIETGNTMVLAQFIQQKTGADLFELKPAVPYPADYQACIDQALAEQDRGDRPAVAKLPDLSTYSTIYFGFPCWWGDIPMLVYTAIEALDWQGKTIAPFNTHEGSGNAGMFGTLARVCEGSTVLDGLTVQGATAQNQRDVAEQRVDEWLVGLGL